MTYEIRENAKYNSHEVYFDAIPPFEVRDALKGLKQTYRKRSDRTLKLRESKAQQYHVRPTPAVSQSS